MTKKYAPMMMPKRFLTILLLFIVTASVAQENSNTDYFTDRFDENGPMEVNLIFNIKDFIKNKDTEDPVEAKISYTLDDGSNIEKKVMIRPRGHNRRDKCYLPPIKIDFTEDDYGVEEFNNMGNTKMVSICKVAGNFDQYLIKEYLIYKAYEKISEYSLKTFFLKVNFIDSEDKRKPFSGYAFLIEDIDALAKRKDANEIERNGLLPVHLYRPVMNPLAVFQFMIGNTDWHVPNQHNIKLLSLNDPNFPQPIPVPYDFDYAGLVNTNYAVPHESLPIANVQERYFMGACMLDNEFKEVVHTFNEHKDEIYQLFEENSYLQKFNITSTINYLDDFYQIINDEKLADKYLFEKCK